MKTRSSLAAVAAAAVLAACGGSDYDHSQQPAPPVVVIPPTTAVPSSASASVAGFIAYLQLLVASAADTLEPVDTSAVVGPTTETAEPLPVD